MIDWKAKLTSRKFWVVVVSALLLILEDGLGLNLDSETIKSFVALVLGYIFTEGAADTVSRFKQ